ncbi:hypothetical protein GGI25_003961 [Coemansia spiralis]|uniref:HBS1-like protein N-terminal domain-containing protein n=1 Tax=Coemansia spiralis TaxID=417178 RepID=A0A9W8KXJ0_9FUNG|nr:hypothetical protein GGI25_003961 [Coemansia spiralis]
MSRHRAIRNLDLNEEFYDDDDGAVYDEMDDLSEQDQLKLLSGIEAVKKAIGSNTGISEQEIKESLWYYYFDEASTIAWLQKTHKLKPKSGQHARNDELLKNARHRPGNPPAQQSTKSADAAHNASSAAPGTGSSLLSLKSLASTGGLSSLSRKPLGLNNSMKTQTGSTSVVGKALAALKTTTPLPINSAVVEKHSKPNLLGYQGGGAGGLSLPQLAARSAANTTRTPVLRNFSGRQTPTPKSTTPEPKTLEEDASTSAALSQQMHRKAGLSAADIMQPSVATLYAQPSSLARFILDNIAPTAAYESKAASLAIKDEFKRDIQELLEANKRIRKVDVAKLLGEGVGGAMAEYDRRLRNGHRPNYIAGDVSFLNILAGKSSSDTTMRHFSFDTPSPDDKVLTAQCMTGSARTAAVASCAAARKKKI